MNPSSFRPETGTAHFGAICSSDRHPQAKVGNTGWNMTSTDGHYYLQNEPRTILPVFRWRHEEHARRYIVKLNLASGQRTDRFAATVGLRVRKVLRLSRRIYPVHQVPTRYDYPLPWTFCHLLPPPVVLYGATFRARAVTVTPCIGYDNVEDSRSLRSVHDAGYQSAQLRSPYQHLYPW